MTPADLIPVAVLTVVAWASFRLGRGWERVDWLSGRRSTR